MTLQELLARLQVIANVYEAAPDAEVTVARWTETSDNGDPVIGLRVTFDYDGDKPAEGTVNIIIG